jgi:hypothetical protein
VEKAAVMINDEKDNIRFLYINHWLGITSSNLRLNPKIQDIYPSSSNARRKTNKSDKNNPRGD